MLERKVNRLPSGYALKGIDGDLYDRCLRNPMASDFVSAFDSKEHYLAYGRGVVILKDGKIVSGASSYARSLQAVEIEVDTVEEERRKGLGSAACAALFLMCLAEGLEARWDAQNLESVHMAEQFGYEFSHPYTAYEIS